jgi:hypothetical protein
MSRAMGYFSCLSFKHENDYELLEKGMLIYDALYSWAQYLQKRKTYSTAI